jgi:tetratricopeptide (TPR) repeat protein
MKKFDFFFPKFFLRSPSILFGCFPAFLLIFVTIFLLACAENRMSVEEARKITVSTNKGSFVPPPRRIDDILTLLNQSGQFDPEVVTKTKARADAVPPETDNYATLANFYVKRGIIARELGRAKQVFEDIHTSWKYAEKARSRKIFKMNKEDYARILAEMGQEEVYLGNFKEGIKFLEQSLNYHRSPGTYRRLAKFHLMIGNYKSGKAVTETGIRFLAGRAGSGYTKSRLLLRSELLHYEGKFEEEELDRRSLLKTIRINQRPRQYTYSISWLAQSLAKQGRLIEAEFEARRALDAALGLAGNRSAVTARTIGTLGEILLAQGRLKDSEQLAQARSRIYRDLGASHDSLLMGEAIKLWGQVAVARSESFIASPIKSES